MIERSRVRLLVGALPGSLGQLSLPSLRSIGKSSTGLLAGVRRDAFTCVGWQITLYDPIWQVTSSSCKMGSPINSYTLLYLYLLPFCGIAKFSEVISNHDRTITI